MHGGFRKWLACTLTAGAVLVGATGVWAEDVPTFRLPEDPGYSLQGPSNQLVSSSSLNQPGPVDLEKRIADLEGALKKMDARVAAEKKKATGKPTVTVGGRVFADAVLFGQSDLSKAVIGDAQDTAFFRSARLHAEGQMFDVYDYKIEMDFAGRDSDGTGSSVFFKDVYLNIRELPYLGNVRIGHFKEPFSLEELTSSRYITFMERSLANVFVPQRNMGIMATNTYWDEYGTWAAGAFRHDQQDDPPFRADDDGGTALTSRITYLPWYDEATQGRGLLHVGFGATWRDEDDDTVRFRARPETGVMVNEAGNSLYIVDTGNIPFVTNYSVFGPELAFVYGPFSVQSEYMVTTVNRRDGLEDPTFHGFYIQTSYFLTGEHRPYSRTKGAFDRVKPFTNFFRVRTCEGDIQTGCGAWEVAYRYSWLDLDDFDAAILGGTAADHTFGVNWYLNPYTRMMFNYVTSDVSRPNNGPDVDVNVFEMRAQFDF